MIGKNSLVQIISNGFSALVSFLILSLSARLFGPEIIGTIAYLLSITGLVFAFSDLGFSRAHVHYTAAKQPIQKTLGTFLSYKTLLLILSSIISIIVIRQINLSYLFIIILLFEIFSRFSESILITFEALQKSLPQNITRLISKLFKLLAIWFLAKNLNNSLGLSLSYLTESMVLIIITLWLSRRFWPFKFNKTLANKYFSYSLPFFAIVPITYIQTKALVLILKSFHQANEVGFYSVSANLSGFIKTLYGSIMMYFFPKISRLFSKNDYKSIQHYADLTIKYLFIFFIPILMLAYLLRQELVLLVLGHQFAPAVPVFSLFLLGTFLLMILSPYDHILYATKNHYPLVKVNIVSLILSLFLAFWLTPSLGAKGIVLASIGAWSLDGIWHFYLIKTRLKLKILPDFFKFTLPAALILLTASYLINNLQPNLMIKLALTILCLSIYISFLYILKLIKRNDIKYFLSLIKPK